MFEAVQLFPGPEQGTAARTGTAKRENGRLQVQGAELVLWAEAGARAERRSGLGPCCWAERNRINPFGSRELLDQLRHLNSHLNMPCPCGFSLLCYACPKIFGTVLHSTCAFQKDTMLIYPRKACSLPTRIWHMDTCLSQEFSVSKTESK